MTPATRRKSSPRPRLIADVLQLEKREMLTASTVHHAALIPAHVEVSTSSKTLHAEKAAHHAATIHAPVSAHPKAPVKPTATLAGHAVTPKHPSLFQSTLQVIKRSQATMGPVPGALSPSLVSTGYTLPTLGVSNQGQGQTIAIVDEYNDTTILNDANVFSTKYGLPTFNTNGNPTLTVYKDSALGVVTNSPAGGGDTSIETSLDVEWAHAIAPRANILLVEVPATGTLANSFAQLLHGVQYGAQHASVVSLSYGYVETNRYQTPGTFIDLPALFAQNQTYLATGAASNVAVTVSSGDYTLALYPSTSPNVIAVGGTALHLTGSGQYSYETAWGGSQTNGAGGGGNSAFYAAPSYQTSNGVTFNGFRATPDVALLADPATGVSVYDSYGTNAGSPWSLIGGTSLAAPLFAGMLSIVQQQRAALSKAPLTSVQIDNALYGLYNSPSYLTYFHDITLGSNTDVFDGYAGFSATTGYDRATGIGSPIAKTLVPYLASL